jgi:hypothetical protein
MPAGGRGRRLRVATSSDAGNYGAALAVAAAVVAIAIVVIAGLGWERKGVVFGADTPP